MRTSYEKTIVCFANARKPPRGTCVAGREFASGHFGAWLRPVSHRPSRELLSVEQCCRGGRVPSVLDVVRLTLVGPEPERHQTENELIDDRVRWALVRRLGWEDIQPAVEQLVSPLWPCGESSLNGVNDRVAENRLNEITRSLYLVRPAHLFVRVMRESRLGGPALKRVRAAFLYDGEQYLLAVTDPRIERRYFVREEGDYQVPEALLCLSLSEPFHGFAYKLAATIITPPRAGAAR